MYDVAIVGAGVIGASIFRELTKYNLKVIILEKENDVAMGTTRANSAIIHAGYDPEEGTLMARYNVAGSELFGELCKALDVPYKQNGSLVIGFNDEDMTTLRKLYENGLKNKVKGIELLGPEETLKKEPNLSSDIKGALYAPTGAIVGPFEYTIALIENGITNGGELKTRAEVIAINKNDERFTLTLKDASQVQCKFVVNAAGVFADKVHNMICQPSYKILPRKGEYFVLDKNQGTAVSHTVFQCPGKMGKGVLVSPTVHGNLIVGPSSLDLMDREDVGVTSEGLSLVQEAAMKTTAYINYRENIRNFSGLRAISDREDFIVEEASVKGFIDAAGMKSPGLSAAPAIALDVVEMLKQRGLPDSLKKDFNPIRKQIRFMELSEEEKAELIKKDARYGRVICRCEGITEGEIIDSIQNVTGATTVDGVKRRCRPGMGRCQGGFCGPRVQEILARELNVRLEDIMLDKEGAYILTGKTK
ncbi:NAD(P)/FAD-dependent oxidoreductase [Cellulosilyticum sp. I15G10I2]|uniref:NAD(P)/FAD-dependent oxidoreductase n=1 Tax=Cellulosilyticum sp. I15G10I2 TaxID=1892843 RepID=UPI00085CBA91|nr:NAD(P)/FAD-dependent oxidoreductase [Cellulosilyticum sp. I15G10I2]